MRDGYHLWSERYDRTLDDVFAVQEDIARSVVEKLRVALLGEPTEPILKRGTDNLEAYEWYLRGRHAWLRLTSEGHAQALEYFGRAQAAQPDYAAAYAGEAGVYFAQAVLGWAAPSDLMPRAREAALRGLSHDPDSADAHLRLAFVLHWYDWEWSRAEAEYRHAIELNPGVPEAHAAIAELLVQVGRPDEAIAHAKKAIKIDPLDLHAQRILATVLTLANRVDDAVDQAQHTLELDRTYVPGLWALAGAYLTGERYADALAACEQGLTLAKDDPLLLGDFGLALGMLGRREEAERLLEQLLRRRRDGYFSALLIAFCYHGWLVVTSAWSGCEGQ